MILTIVFIAVTFLVVVGVMLAYWPKGVSVNENDQIQLGTYIGKPQLIPVDEITITEMPEGLLNHLIRTNGMSLGKINYGHFKNTKTGQKMFLYLTGKESKICFCNGKTSLRAIIIYLIGDHALERIIKIRESLSFKYPVNLNDNVKDSLILQSQC